MKFRIKVIKKGMFQFEEVFDTKEECLKVLGEKLTDDVISDGGYKYEVSFGNK